MAKQGNQSQLKPVINTPDRRNDHAKEREERRKKRQAMREQYPECLTASRASYFENQKPLKKYDVCAKVLRSGRNGFEHVAEPTHQVMAQNEKDAWAKYCDVIQDHPSPKHCEIIIREITDDA